MSTTIHVGKSRTMSPITASDGSAVSGLTAFVSDATVLTAVVNPDNSVTRAALKPGSPTITYHALNAVGVVESLTILAPPLPTLVLGTDGPEV